MIIFAQFGGGSGTEEAPYRIYTKQHLEELSDSLIALNSFEGNHFKLMNNINEPLTEPIGTGATPPPFFQGFFHGSGYYITIYIEETYNSTFSLFTLLGQNSTIDSLILEGYMFRCNGFAWQNRGTISNCINNVVTSSLFFEDFDCGFSQAGICAVNYGLINSCINNSNLYNSFQLAGIAYSNFGQIYDCTNNGNIFGSNCTYTLAGIVHFNHINGIIDNCNNNGDITFSEEYLTGSFAGGICAIQLGGNIVNCKNQGKIYNKAFVFTGGITGIFKSGEILNSANYGDILGKHHIGGIVGGYYSLDFNSNADTIGTAIRNCFNSAKISADSISYGIRGDMHHTDTISNCLNIGEIPGSAIVDTSSNENTYISNNFYDKQMIPQSFGIGFSDFEGQAEGKLTTQLTGTSPELQAMLGDGWSYAEDRYPIPLGLENDSMALVAATPVYLHFVTEDDYNHVDSVCKNFTVGLENNVSWESANDHVSFNNENITLLSMGMEMITVSLGGYSKNVRINIVDIETFAPAQIIETGITAYPNPAGEFISLNLNGIQADKMEICDITGKAIFCQIIAKEHNPIHIGNINPGMYLLKIYNKNQNITTLRFVKN
jgi:hypothetical protein